MDDIVDGSVTVMMTLASTATKAVIGETVHLRTIVMACVGPAKRGTSGQPQSLGCCHQDGVQERALIMSQAPDSFVETAKRRALDVASGAPFSKESAEASTLWASQDFCWKAAEPTGGVCT